MTDDECLQRFGLTPSSEFAGEIRQLLAEETAKERRSQGDGDGELMKLNCVQLYSIGDLSDVLHIWQAKQSSFDKACYIDVQLLCGAGRDETLDFLDGIASDEARAAASHIRQCVDAGDFDGFTRDAWLAQYREYFGV